MVVLHLLSSDALIAIVGIETDIMRFGYSYDITISELTPATGGAHELSTTMKFDCKSKKASSVKYLALLSSYNTARTRSSNLLR